MHADDKELRFAAIDDVADCVRFLVDRDLAPQDRIACCGWSYGGYLTQAALTFHPELFAAGISICGMSDLGTFYRNTEPWIAAAAYPKYGHPINDRELLDRLSPLLRVRHSPLRYCWSTAPTTPMCRPANRSKCLTRCAALGRTVECLMFDDDGHQIVKRENREALVRAIDGLAHYARSRRHRFRNQSGRCRRFGEIVRRVNSLPRQLWR